MKKTSGKFLGSRSTSAREGPGQEGSQTAVCGQEREHGVDDCPGLVVDEESNSWHNCEMMNGRATSARISPKVSHNLEE